MASLPDELFLLALGEKTTGHRCHALHYGLPAAVLSELLQQHRLTIDPAGVVTPSAFTKSTGDAVLDDALSRISIRTRAAQGPLLVRPGIPAPEQDPASAARAIATNRFRSQDRDTATRPVSPRPLHACRPSPHCGPQNRASQRDRQRRHSAARCRPHRTGPRFGRAVLRKARAQGHSSALPIPGRSRPCSVGRSRRDRRGAGCSRHNSCHCRRDIIKS
jgi:hypothetical protein